MRWDGLRVTTFDTPGFAGMTFYEVRAKSIINRVPSQSRMPFEWTVNPYRGCTHACVYCLAGDTAILTGDGRTKPLAQLKVGDLVYGTVRQGRFRRYTVTQVLDHWSTVKPAYRILLEDGTTLVASGDHQFLSDRGWKYVTGRMGGDGQRPYLTVANKLMGTGQFAAPVEESADYRHGYLRGMIRDDGRPGSSEAEAVQRTRRYLASFGEAAAEPLRIGWPAQASSDWRKGFLAGVFDAKGSHSGGILRIASTDPELIGRTGACLRQFGFDFAVEDRRQPNGLRCIRMVGGLPEKLRFFHTVDPAITRKRGIEGTAVKSGARLRVVSIEPLGVDLPLYDITTGTGDFIANGVISHNCFARNTHTYLDLDSGHDFDTKVVVKVNAGSLLRRELAAPRWKGHEIAMGTNVDCYQRAEGRYGLMREILAALRDFANPFSILTKGTLILRDLDLLTEAAAMTRVGLAMSIGFVDHALWRSVEPGTPSPRRRLDAVRQLTDAGFRVTVLMAPILPELTDTDESIDATVRAIARAGAAGVVPIPLHLRTGAREWYLTWLAREHRHLLARYRELYGRGAYLGPAYQREISARVGLAMRRYGIPSSDGRHESVAPVPAPEQLTLL